MFYAGNLWCFFKMHLHFERNANSKCDCPILSLTWMGKVPDELPEVRFQQILIYIMRTFEQTACFNKHFDVIHQGLQTVCRGNYLVVRYKFSRL